MGTPNDRITGAVTMRDVIVIGGGCYGTFYAGQLVKARERGKARFRRRRLVEPKECPSVLFRNARTRRMPQRERTGSTKFRSRKLFCAQRLHRIEQTGAPRREQAGEQGSQSKNDCGGTKEKRIVRRNLVELCSE